MSRVYHIEDAREVLEDRDRREYPVMTAPEVAEELGSSRPTAVSRLEELVERDEAEQVNIGEARAFHLADEQLTVTHHDPDAAAETESEGDEGEEDAPDPETVADGAGVDVDAVLQEYGSATRQRSYADRGAAALFVGVGVSLLNQVYALPESIVAFAGVGILYGIYALGVYLLLRYNSDDAAVDLDAVGG